jgi:predicted permease
MNGRPVLANLSQDLQYAVRLLRRAPGVTATIVITLALGVGANALVFSIVNGLLLRPLPVERPDRLVFVQGNSGPANSYPNYVDLRDRNTTLEGLIAYRIAPMSVEFAGVSGPPARRWGYLATGNYFDVLGVRPAAGRFFHAADDRRPGAAPLAVISYDEWLARYGGNPGAIGSTIRINTFTYTIIGVAPRGFVGTERFYRPAIWVPMMMEAQIEVGNPWLDHRATFNVWVVGRLAPSVTRAQAQANLNAIAAQLARDYPWPNRGMAFTLTEPGFVGSVLGTPVRAFTLGVQSLAALVLLAACANLASLLSARGSDRRREIAIRMSIGAGRGRLIRQLLTESLLLALAGGAAGAALAWMLALALSTWRAPLDLPVQFDVAVDLRVLAFACLVSGLAGVLFGVLPALQAAAADPNAALKRLAEGARTRRWSMRELLVTLQMVLCFVLVSACLLSVRGLQRAVTMPLGFEPGGVTVAGFDLGLAGYDRARGEAFQRRVLDAVGRLPGVAAAAYSNSVPLSVDQSQNSIYPEGAQPGEGPADVRRAVTYQISPGFFRTIGTRLLAGRDFDWHDSGSTARVAIVNEAFARQILRTSNPLGRRFRFGPAGALTDVIGVVEDAKYQTLTESPTAAVFTPMLQMYNSTTVLSVRSSGPSDVSAIRQAIAIQDPSLPVYDAKPMQEMLGLALFPSRAAAIALGAFGVLAISLAVTGLYGVVSYAVSRREREIGIRIAIGAGAATVLRLVLARTAALVLSGAVAGAVLAFLLARVLASIVYMASPHDPAVFLGVAMIMLIVGTLSCWAPAARALRISPTAALKAE